MIFSLIALSATALSGILFLQLAALAFFVTLAVTGFMRPAGLGDVADGRSAHKKTTPTGGGLGFVAGLGAAAIAMCWMDVSSLLQGHGLHRGFAPILSLVFAVSMLGIVDDIYALSARIKFGILLILCSVAVYLIGPATQLPFAKTGADLPYIIGFIGSVLWIFVTVNAVNFMDGANGFMGTVMTIASFGLFGVSIMSGAPGAAVLSLLTAAMLLGFLPYNYRRKAAIFSGDVGALFVGFTFAAAALMLVAEAESSATLYAGPLLILPFLTDVLLTLIRRVRRKDNILKAHNMHLYQRLIRGGANGNKAANDTGWSHMKVTWLYAAIGLILANAVLVFTHIGQIGAPELLPLCTGMIVFGYYMVSRDLPD